MNAIRELNLARLAEVGDPEISTRIASYELAHRMQTSGPGTHGPSYREPGNP